MKKMMFILACVLTLAIGVKADDYRPITREQLPEKAQTFLATYFPNSKTSLIRKDLDLTDLSYDLIFVDGCKVEFDRKGNWTEVDCITHPVPTGIVPEAISKTIKAQYPDASITKIERDHRHYEVTLSNRTELTFNKNMQLIDID